ncbi:T9SS type A sorting domain-containing protein [Neolewinella antarctica]|uniref:Secretion system C-terminal sorting domain-containing protein n=1 Tax=Neolewinella antarctica TaxID=442734 RepID=A0ABX0XDS3_9BACT|nr:T9SS type A sorting domain-containing protein [Neolewinella antarctica]NJC27357.1 hypothetical protein [Neolewinella antarctica]
MKTAITSLLCLLSFAAMAQPTPFNCTSNDGFGYYISAGNLTNANDTYTSANSRLSRLRTRDGVRTELCAATDIDVSLNALAFNPNDRYLYATSAFDDTDFSGVFYRLGANCEKTRIPVGGAVVRYGDNVGATANAGGGIIGSGTFDLDNNYYVNTIFVGEEGRSAGNLVQKINLTGDSATVVSSQVMTCPTCVATGTDTVYRIADIIFDENSGELFGHDNLTDILYTIDAMTGVLEPVGASSVLFPILGIYKNRDGDIRAIDTEGNIYSVSTVTGNFTLLVADGDIRAGNADAASGCYAPATISGTLFIDANGLTDATVNGTPSGTAGTDPVFVSLLRDSIVLESVAIGTDGTYVFTGDFDGTNFEVRLTTIRGTEGQFPPPPALPGTYQFVGDNVGTGSGDDGFPSGRLLFSVVDGESIANVNFGINDKPTAADVTVPLQVNPQGNARVNVPVSVADTEDGTPTTLTFNAPDPNFEGTLYYNGTALTTTSRISNFNPALFEFDPVDGFVSVSFLYNTRDRASVTSDAATINLAFSSSSPLAEPTPFLCSGNDGFGYFISSAPGTFDATTTVQVNSSSRLSRLRTRDGERTLLCSAAEVGVSLNALAFNPNDNFLYAVSVFDANEFSGKLFRLGSNCQKEAISVSGGIKRYNTNNATTVDASGGVIGSGTFDLDNNYYVNTSFALVGSDGFRNEIQKINLSNNVATVVSTQTLTCPSCTTTTKVQINDIIFDEASGRLIGSNNQTNNLYVINDTTGVITPIGASSVTEAILGTYKNRDGDVRAIATDGVIYAVNIETGAFDSLTTADDLRTGNADAASGCYAPAILSGNVFVDANGRTDRRVSGTPTNTVAGAQLFAVLINRNSPLPVVEASKPVASDGTYAFEGDFADGDYEVRLGTNDGQVGASPPSQGLPNTHRFISEFIGFGTGVETGSGGRNGRLRFSLIDGNSLSNINFGINTRPLVSAVNASFENPGGTDRVEIPNLPRTDAEDGVPTTIRIRNLPDAATEGILYYDDVAVTERQNIDNFQPALLTFDPVDGDVTISFTYEARDRARSASTRSTVTMAFTSASLPVTLVSFSGAYEENTVNLNWRTASEYDTDYFVVERSSTGADFVEIGRVGAAGYSSALLDYQLVDRQPLREAYYRLKDVDFDGTFSYSNVINLSRADWVRVDVYPSPVTNELTVAYDASKASLLNVSFYSVDGKRLLSHNLTNGARQINVTNLPAGFYSVVITDGKTGSVTTRKVVKK